MAITRAKAITKANTLLIFIFLLPPICCAGSRLATDLHPAHIKCRGGQEKKRPRRDAPQSPLEHHAGQRWLNENRSAVRISFNCPQFSRKERKLQPLFTEWSKNGRFWSVDISVSIKVPQYIVVFGFAEFKPARVTFRLWRAP